MENMEDVYILEREGEEEREGDMDEAVAGLHYEA